MKLIEQVQVAIRQCIHKDLPLEERTVDLDIKLLEKMVKKHLMK